VSELGLQLLRYVLLAFLLLFTYRAVRVVQDGLRAAAAEEVARCATLVVEEASPELRGRLFVVTSGAVIGRSPSAEVVLPDEFTSAQHARLVVRGSHFWVEDLGSKNGTFLNGRRLEAPAPLEDGDQLRIGRVTLRFRWPK